MYQNVNFKILTKPCAPCLNQTSAEKSDKKFSLDILTKLQLLYQTVDNTFLVGSNIDNCSNINNFSFGIFAHQSHSTEGW